MSTHIARVFIELNFLARIKSWDIESQIEISVLQSLLREYGANVIMDMPSVCTVESEVALEGKSKRLDFWFKMRGTWTFFSLDVRAPDILVLRDRR